MDGHRHNIAGGIKNAGDLSIQLLETTTQDFMALKKLVERCLQCAQIKITKDFNATGLVQLQNREIK